MQPSLETALALTPEEARTYSLILQATSTLPKSDPRYALVIGVTWWLLHRRRRMEQQLIRRRHFSRRLRRLMYLRWQMQRNSLQGISSAMKTTESAMTDDLGDIPEKRLWVKSELSTGSGDFWSKFDNGELSPEVFMKNFHMTQATFDFIYKELADHLRKANTTMREPLPGKKRLAATLYRLATNAEYLKVAGLFGIGKSTTTSLVRDVCDVIVTILKNKYMEFNVTEKTAAEAEAKFKIPQVVGAFGSIDVFIVGSSWDYHESSPFSSLYSQSYALVFQAVVDHLGYFKHVSAGSPAGFSNSQVLKRSKLDTLVNEKWSYLKKDIHGVQVPAMVVADDSYQSAVTNDSYSWLLTPFKKTEELDEKKQKLNDKIHEAQVVFEDAVAKVKSRWKIFHGKNGKINFNADAFENIAMACCILHNICEMKGDPIDPSWTTDVQDSLFVRKGNTTPGKDADRSMDNDAMEMDNNDDDGNGESNMRPEIADILFGAIKDALAFNM